MHTETEPVMGFESTGLTPVILSVLERNGFTVPTPIQAQAIPVALTRKDIIGIAQTGTGKTLAFGLPIVDELIQNHGKALIIVPTRELALQVEESLRKAVRGMNPGIRTICLIGGMPIYRQIKDLRSNPSIIIGTPGRLRDHLDQKTLNISGVTTLVLDEADRMLDMGFAPQIKYVCSFLPQERQTMLFSATMAPEIANLANAYLTDPTRIEIARAGTSNQLIRQELRFVTHDGKTEALQELLEEHAGSVLVFSRTKHGATKLAAKLGNMGHTSAEIHSNRSLGQRRQALDGFKAGRYRVLVATDVAARGIDVHNIGLVVNFDLPDAAEDYVHRIGRTGRAGNEGVAISFATMDQIRDVQAIERLIKKELELSERSLSRPSDNRSMAGNGQNRRRSTTPRGSQPRSFNSSPNSGGQNPSGGQAGGGRPGFKPRRSGERTPVWGGRFA